MLAIAPGVVIAYERNRHINARLCAQGTGVITIPDSELARGHGGPRCLTCPIEQSDLPRLTAIWGKTPPRLKAPPRGRPEAGSLEFRPVKR